MIPGKGEPEHMRQFFYTSDDYELDKKTPQDQPTIFVKLRDEAYEYAKQLTSPAHLNWVEVTWIWY